MLFHAFWHIYPAKEFTLKNAGCTVQQNSILECFLKHHVTLKPSVMMLGSFASQ